MRIVLGANFPGGICLGCELSWVGIVLGGSCPGWELSGGNFPGGNCPSMLPGQTDRHFFIVVLGLWEANQTTKKILARSEKITYGSWYGII